MKTLPKVVIAVTLAFAALTAAPAMAHHRHGHAAFGFYFGGPAWYPGPYYYPPPAYYYPPPVVIQQSAPTYVERPVEGAPPPQSAPQQSSNDWYYCRDTQTYYPYVQQCASPWQRIAPKPAS